MAAEAATEVGRRVDEALAADRRLIALVAARRALYARSDLPVASYHKQVRALWQDVADQMGWSVAEVRRKWSHLRNSYSRHLRNAVAGARTGRGRAVSRWHLADDLAFLRDHMATDTRAAVAYAPSMLALQMGDTSASSETDAGASTGADAAAWAGVRAESWAGGSDAEEGSFSEDEGSSYFQFFRGLHEEYRLLAPSRRRAWRRACLHLLHAELDAAEAGGTHARTDVDVDVDADADSQEMDVKPVIVDNQVLEP